MKKLSLIIVVSLVAIGVATAVWAVIEGTPHDVAVMRNLGAGSELERCAMCHTPHQSTAATGRVPLWNRSQDSPTTYAMYNLPPFDMGKAEGYPDINSNNYATFNCLVCHNGVASQLVNYPGPASVTNAYYNFDNSLLDTWSNLGDVMKNDHPVGFTYDPSKDTEDNGFKPATDWGTQGKKAIQGSRGTYPLYTKVGSSTVYDRFECATCHSVHDTIAYDGKLMVGGQSKGTQVYFLRADNSGSGMCNDCHIRR